MSLQNTTRETKATRHAKPRVRVIIVKSYYVEFPGGGIYGGPFDTKAEAQQCLKEYNEVLPFKKPSGVP